MDLSERDKNLKVTGTYAEKDFFKVFSFDLVVGDINSVPLDKKSIVLSEKTALNLFGTTKDVVGKW